jgi:CRP-like cAMP-binding protein
MASMMESAAFEPDDAFTQALRYPAGVTLCRQGDVIREVFHVEDGLVKLQRLHSNGRERIVGLRAAGWYVGATAAILGEPAAATAVTLTASHVSRIPAGCFRDRLRNDLELSWRIHRMHSREIQIEMIEAGDLGASRARDRLVSFLRSLPAIATERSSGTHRVVVPLRQWELAQLLGMTAPYLCRLLADLEREGTIRRRGAVFVLSREEEGSVFRSRKDRVAAAQ